MKRMQLGYLWDVKMWRLMWLIVILLSVVTKCYSQREIILNTTGYGFDRNAENGVNPNQRQYINKFIGVNYQGLDASPTCIRLHIQWEQYEQSPGVYSTDKLKAAIKALTELTPNMKVALHFPYQRAGSKNDKSFLSTDEIASTYNGTLLRNSITYTYPSLYSEMAKLRFFAFVNSALSSIQEYHPKLLYVTMGNSQAEEYVAPIFEGNGYTEWGYYDQSSRDAWENKYFKKRFSGSSSFAEKDKTIPQAKPLPFFNPATETQIYPPNGGYWNTTEGKELHRFAAWGLLVQFKAFYETVKNINSNIQVIYFISDFGSQQGNLRFLHNSTIPLAMDLADGIYTSDGNNIYDLWRKIAGIDVAKGSHPDKIASLESDPVDLGQTSPGSGIDANLADEWYDRAFKHGTNYIHIAMHFHDNEIQQLRKAIAKNKQKYITQTYTSPVPTSPIQQNLYPKVFGSEFLFPQWRSTGENWSVTDKNPTFIQMTDDGYWENIWENSNYLPCDFSLSSTPLKMTSNPSQTVSLNVVCNGGECDRVIIDWDGPSVNENDTKAIKFNAPSNQGTYTYVATIRRSGCTTRAIATKLTVQQPLPIKLVSFSGLKLENQINLEWKTSEEVNSEKFEIQRSNDAKTWASIGVVNANGAQFTGLHHYAFTDINPVATQNFYRLKLIDQDQTFAYSRIINVKKDAMGELAIYPNPVHREMFIQDTNWGNIESVSIFNKNGIKIITYNQLLSPEIDASQLDPDLYLINLHYKDGSSTTRKFIKK